MFIVLFVAKQLEQAKIKVQEETPVFNVMDPAQVPLKRVNQKLFQFYLQCFSRRSY